MDYSLFENAPLAPLCSMKVGGNAKFLVFPESENGLASAISRFKESGERYIIVGKCSNLIFPDGGFDGAVIMTTEMKGTKARENGLISLCGEPLSVLARTACENQIGGLEFLYGIPGTVGGAVYMNAGAYGGEISQVFISGRFLDENLNIITLSREEMDFGYRKSRIMQEELILISAEFCGIARASEEIRAEMEALMAKRKAKQPLEFPSCGSAFKRPAGNFAGALIEQCGLKGFSIGGAAVSEKHSGFIINKGGATAGDVIALLKAVSETVLEKTGIMLEPEIRVIE